MTDYKDTKTNIDSDSRVDEPTKDESMFDDGITPR